MAAQTTEEAESLWEELIKQYVADSPQANKQDCNLVILGNRSAGARSLLARMAGKDIDDAYEGFALEYDSIDVRHEDDDDDEGEVYCHINIWHVESPAHSDLLKLALPPDALPYTILMILTDLSCASTVMEHVEEWSVRLVDYINEAWKEKGKGKRADMDDKVLQHLAQIQQEAKAKKEAAQTQNKRRKRGMSLFARQENVTVIRAKEEEKEEEKQEVNAELGPGMLTTNFGMPVIVVGTKSDAIEEAAREACRTLNSAESNFKQVLYFMQAHLRKWCLAHGSGLVFTSSRKDTGIDFLMDYIKHRAFGFQLAQEIVTNRHENVFVPFGQDDLATIKSLNFQDIGNLDTSYGQVIQDPKNPQKKQTEEVPKQGKSLKSILQKKFMLSAGVKAFQSASEQSKVDAMDHQTFLRRQIELQKMRERTEYMSTYRQFVATGNKSDKATERDKQREHILAQVKQEQDGQSKKGKNPSAESDTSDAAQFFATMMKTYNSFRKPA